MQVWRKSCPLQNRGNKPFIWAILSKDRTNKSGLTMTIQQGRRYIILVLNFTKSSPLIRLTPPREFGNANGHIEFWPQAVNSAQRETRLGPASQVLIESARLQKLEGWSGNPNFETFSTTKMPWNILQIDTGDPSTAGAAAIDDYSKDLHDICCDKLLLK